jgi:hypothetical protein
MTIMSKKLFVIGLNYYGTPYQLSGCLNDIQNIEARYLPLGFTDVTRWIETESHSTQNEPNKKSTLESLSNWIKSSKSGDFLALHYSGHGTQVPDDSHDEKDGSDEAICLLDDIVSDDELKQIMVDQLPHGVKLRCLFDCCHSGTILDLPWNWKVSVPMGHSPIGTEKASIKVGKSSWDDENKDHAIRDIIMVSGCTDSQTSADAWIEAHKSNEGAMTWAWLQCLDFANQHHTKMTWHDAILKMRFTLLEGGYDQIPQIALGDKTLIDTKVEFLSQ